MATVTQAATSFSTASGTKTPTATPAVGDLIVIITAPAVGDLIVIITAHTGNTAGNAPTDNNSGGAGTYTLAESRVKNASADLMQIWVRDALITAATSTVVTIAPGASSGGGGALIFVSGMTKVGAAAIKKVGGQDNAGAGTPTITWTGGGSADTNNPCIGAVFNASNPAAVAPPSGWTEDGTNGDVGYATPAAGLETAYINSGFTGSSITWGGASASAFASVAIELDASPSVPTNPDTIFLRSAVHRAAYI